MAATTAKSVVDTRILGKPKNYYGQQDGWPDWSFAMRAYLSCLSETMADLLNAAEKSSKTIELGPLPEAAKAEARQLYYILALQCNGSALQVVKGVEKNNGFEAWRRMLQRHEPAEMWSTAVYDEQDDGARLPEHHRELGRSNDDVGERRAEMGDKRRGDAV